MAIQTLTVPPIVAASTEMYGNRSLVLEIPKVSGPVHLRTTAALEDA